MWALSLLLLLLDELLLERCRTADLSPDVLILGLPPSSVNSKVLGLDVFVNCSVPTLLLAARKSEKWGK